MMMMGCYVDENDGTREGLLTFGRDELLYDVCNYAYIEGHIMDKDSNHARHAVQDVGEQGNVDRVTRVLETRVAQCRELLYPYTKHDVWRHELHDALKEKRAYGIALKLPKGFSQTTLTLLERLVHEYLVCSAVADWLSITKPEKSEAWVAKARDAEDGIRRCMNTRMGRVRRRCQPF